MDRKTESLVSQVTRASQYAKAAFWSMRGIDADDIDNLAIMSKIQDVIELLRMVDDITLDIVISIKSNA